jgi:hypothetical protein
MIFYETLQFSHVIKLAINRRKAYFNKKSTSLRIIERFICNFSDKIDIVKLSFGDIQIATDIRKNAYLNAHSAIDSVRYANLSHEASLLFGINFQLIAKKFFFDELYTKYEFLELAMRCVAEHSGKANIFYVDSQFIQPYIERLENYGKIYLLKRFNYLCFIFSLFTAPLGLLLYWKMTVTKKSLSFDNEILCCIDGESTYEMFNSIFGQYPKVSYLIEKHNLREFSSERLKELNIHTLGLTREGYLYLKKRIFNYIHLCLKYHADIARYGDAVIFLFYSVMKGRAEGPHGKGNILCIFEHLVTIKAVRNEFLRSEGSLSCFISKNIYSPSPYLHSEIFTNYDIVCASGKQTKELYQKQMSLTKVFLPTGAYDIHRRVINRVDKNKRIDSLKTFKSNAQAVTILSPGICDPTYSHEIKLMKLAQKLSSQNGIKVFVRLKPVPLIPKYAGFYSHYIQGQDSIMLTSQEYELFDFLEISDLFITSISTSACDVAMCGGQVMFIDFMKDPDLFLYWTVVSDIILNEENAFEKIMLWLNDKKGEQVRSSHAETMKRLTDYIGYRFPDFESYKANLLAQLQKHVFCNNPVLRGD